MFIKKRCILRSCVGKGQLSTQSQIHETLPLAQVSSNLYVLRKFRVHELLWETWIEKLKLCSTCALFSISSWNFIRHFINTIRYYRKSGFCTRASVRGLLQVYNFTCILNPPELRKETIRTYLKLTEKKIHANLTIHENHPCLYELMKLHQLHKTWISCTKYKNKLCVRMDLVDLLQKK